MPGEGALAVKLLSTKDRQALPGSWLFHQPRFDYQSRPEEKTNQNLIALPWEPVTLTNTPGLQVTEEM